MINSIQNDTLLNQTEDVNKTKDDKIKLNRPLVNSFSFLDSNPDQASLNNLFLKDSTASNHLQNVENIDLNKYVLKNSNPIIDQGTWFATRLLDGRTVYRQNDATNGQFFSTKTSNHLTSNPTDAYSGPLNFIDSTVTIMNKATVSGSNFLFNNNGPFIFNNLIINGGGTLTDSNIFNQIVEINNGGSSNNNTYISAPVTLNNGSTSDSDTFINPNTTRSGYSLDGQSFSGQSYKNTSSKTFQSSDNGSADININGTSKVTKPHIPDLYQYNPSTNNTTVYVNSNEAQYCSPGQLSGSQIDNYMGGIIISNDHFNIIGSSSDCTIYIGREYYADETGNMLPRNVYKDATGHILYQSNEPVNIYNVGHIYILDGAVVDGAEIFANNSRPQVYVQKGGTLTNSNIYDSYIGIEQGGRSINNTYYSPEFSMNGHNIDGLSKNDTIYESSGTCNGYINLSNTKNAYIDPNNPPIYNDKTKIPDPNTSTPPTFQVSNGLVNLTVGNTGQFINPIIMMNKSYSISYRPGQGTGDNPPCYLEGTLIETSEGVKAIENIQVGDSIYIYHEATKILKPVTWIGSNRHVIYPNQPDDVAGYPICILKNALANNIPFKDTYITPEHCLYIDGKFILARMLVNNRTIFYDHSKPEYTYYHLELDGHAVIKANGMLSESYLNTNNHNNFYKTDSATISKKSTKKWTKDSVAPMVITKEIVQPIYNIYEQRAIELGIKTQIDPFETTSFANLYVITDKGKVIYPQWPVENVGNYIFILPDMIESVYIISNSSRPSDAIGPYIDDRRSLGVLIETITLFDQKDNYYIKTHLENHKLSGWYGQENASCRWTNGYALLPLNRYNLHKGRKVLTLKVIAAGPYVQEKQINLGKQVS